MGNLDDRVSSDYFDFGVNYVLKILKLFISNDRFCKEFIDVIPNGVFEHPIHNMIFKIVKGYYDRYRELPTTDFLLQNIPDGVSEERYLKCLLEISDIEVNDEQYIRDMASEFVRNYHYKQLIIQGADLVKRRDYDTLDERIRKVQQIGVGATDFGIDYFTEKERRLERVVSSEHDKVPTLICELDNLLQGGLDKGEVGTVVAPSSGGKSALCVMFSKSALICRKNVLYITLEMLEQQIMWRFDMSFMGKTSDEVYSDFGGFMDQLYKYGETCGGRLNIKSFPQGTTKFSDIEKYFDKLSDSVFTPDLLVVDYVELLNSGNGFGEYRFHFKTLYESLKGFATKHHIPVWTAAQTNRESGRKRIITAEDISESMYILNNSDVIVSINRVAEDIQKKRTRLYVIKNRMNVKDKTVVFYPDFAKMTFDTDERKNSRLSVVNNRLI